MTLFTHLPSLLVVYDSGKERLKGDSDVIADVLKAWLGICGNSLDRTGRMHCSQTMQRDHVNVERKLFVDRLQSVGRTRT